MGGGVSRRGGAVGGGAGSRAAFLWVLRGNPSRWFYQRLGGRLVAESATRVAGVSVPQTAYAWDPIERLIAASPAA